MVTHYKMHTYGLEKVIVLSVYIDSKFDIHFQKSSVATYSKLTFNINIMGKPGG